MRFTEPFLRTVRDRVSIAAYAGRKLAWDKRKSQPAKGDYWACCPFHGEKSASFHVVDAKGFYKCFGCGESGDVITLAMKLEGLAFPEAVERLAGEAGLALPARGPEDAAAVQRARRVGDAVAAAARAYREALLGAGGRQARDYLERRGLPAETWAAFGIGYAPPGPTWLLDRLQREGFAPDALAAAGLIRQDDGRRPIDVFRDRVTFEIADGQGRPIAFGGRAMAADAKAKYINSPETALFHKGRTLYRLKEAREVLARAPTAPLAVVEGYLDAIAMARAGIAAVAPLGTALTEDQLDLLWRLRPDPILCFDGDAAGARAAARALDLALPKFGPEGRTARIATAAPGQDPDDLYRAGGAEALQALLASARPALDMLYDLETAERPLTTPEARAHLKARLKARAERIADPEARFQYRKLLLAKADAALKAADEADWRRRRTGPKAPRLAATPGTQARARGEKDRVIVDILKRAVDWPSVLGAGWEALAALAIADPELDRIRHAILALVAEGKTVDRDALTRHLTSLNDERAAARIALWPAPPLDPERRPSAETLARLEAEWMALVNGTAISPQIDADLAGLRAQGAMDEDEQAFRRACEMSRAKWDADRDLKAAKSALDQDGGADAAA